VKIGRNIWTGLASSVKLTKFDWTETSHMGREELDMFCLFLLFTIVLSAALHYRAHVCHASISTLLIEAVETGFQISGFTSACG
jgi:hypothetical protein